MGQGGTGMGCRARHLPPCNNLLRLRVSIPLNSSFGLGNKGRAEVPPRMLRDLQAGSRGHAWLLWPTYITDPAGTGILKLWGLHDAAPTPVHMETSGVMKPVPLLGRSTLSLWGEHVIFSQPVWGDV